MNKINISGSEASSLSGSDEEFATRTFAEDDVHGAHSPHVGHTHVTDTLSHFMEAVRDDHEQTRLEDATRVISNAYAESVNINELVDVELARLESEKAGYKMDDADDFVLTEEQQKIKDAGYSMEDILDPPPDGGWGWICVLCSLLLAFSTWGTNLSFGVFLDYYINENFFQGATKVQYAFIGGLVVAISQVLSSFIFLSIEVIGIRPTLLVGTVLIFLGNFLASYCTTLWQLFLTQGVLSGLSFAFLYFASITIIPSWFLYKRALATGIILSGAGLGGLTFSLSVNAIIDKTGSHQWALKMQGIVTAAVCLVSSLLIRERRPRPLERNLGKLLQRLKILLDYRVVKERSILHIYSWYIFANIGFSQLAYSLSAYGTSIGLSSSQGSHVTAIMNATQLVARPLIGLYADRFGRVNFTLAATAYLCITVFAFWINVTNYASFVAFGVVSGLALGSVNVMCQPMTADAIPPSQFPAAFSFVNIGVAPFSLTAEAISIAMVDNSKAKPFLNTQIFGGSCFLAAFILLFPAREVKVKKILLARKDSAEKKLQMKELDKEEISMLEKRISKYSYLLRKGSKAYFERMLYPIRA